MSIFFAVLVVGVLALGAAQAQNVPLQNCHGSPNLNSVWTQNPQFVSSVANGKLFLAGGENVSPKINVVHVWGTPYEMGYAAGSLLKEQLSVFIPELLKDAEDAIEAYIPFLPKEWQDFIAENGTAAVLDATYHLTKNYIDPYFIQEMQGWADGSGIAYETFRRINMVPETIKAHCTIIGAWGPAVNTPEGSLIQLRALDWATNTLVQTQPMVMVYHPTEGSGMGHAFANMAWIGFVGSLTGYSSANVGICEKVWLHYNGTYSPVGIPWTFLLRNILQFDSDVDSALTRIANARRTCSIFVGVGDSQTMTARVVEYGHDFVEFYNDKNFPSYENHPIMSGLVWVDKHTQPSNDPCLTTLLENFYGQINADVMFKNITAQFQTGDTQVAVYDYGANFVYLSNAGVSTSSAGGQPAYDREFTAFNMTALFGEPMP